MWNARNVLFRKPKPEVLYCYFTLTLFKSQAHRLNTVFGMPHPLAKCLKLKSPPCSVAAFYLEAIVKATKSTPQFRLVAAIYTSSSLHCRIKSKKTKFPHLKANRICFDVMHRTVWRYGSADVRNKVISVCFHSREI